MSLGDGFDGAVDGVDLVVARLLAAAVVKIVFGNRAACLLIDDAAPGAVALPKLIRCGETIQTELTLYLRRLPGAVMHQKTVAIRAEYERDVEHFRIMQSLLHAIAKVVFVVLGFDDGNRDIGLVVQNVIGALGLTARVQLAAHDDTPFGEGDFFADLGVQIPTGLNDGWCDVFAANISLGQVLLIQSDSPFLLPRIVRLFACR